MIFAMIQSLSACFRIFSVTRAILFIILGIYISIWDNRHQVIPKFPPILLFLFAIVYSFLMRRTVFSLYEIALTSGFVFLLWILMHDQIGAGDLIILFIFSFFFELEYWVAGLFITGILGFLSAIYLFVKYKGVIPTGMRIAFVPYLFAGFISSLILTRYIL